MNKTINFEVESAEIIEENPDSQFATARIQAFASGINKHDMICSEDILHKTAPTIFNKPILYSIDKVLNDFYTHVAPDKSLIAGFVVPNSAEFIQLQDSRLSLNVLARIWKRYAPKVIEYFARDSSAKKKVSVEMELYDTSERPDGLVEMLDFAYAGITLLGDYITEASPGAHAEMLSFAEENEKYKEAVELEFGRYDDVDFTIPAKVKENAQKAFDLYKKHNVGGGSASLSNAKYLLKNEKASPERIRYMIKKLQYQKKKDVASNEESPSGDYVNWMMYGGSDGLEWCGELYSKLEELDNKKISYFSDLVTFPYVNKEDMNPALKGIDPPISVSQGNAIAKQAEAIGSDDEKNGWAIAIANFKKTHKVVEGKWVSKKEEMSVEDKKVESEFAEEEKKEEEVKEEKMAETPEEEKKEDPKEEEKETPEEEKKEEFSLDPYLDVKATLAFLEKETEDYAEVAAEFSKPYAEMNYAKVMGAMYAKMCKMAEKMANMEKDAEVYMAENEELKKFKSDKEQEQFTFAVDVALKDIESKTEITVDELELLREKSKEFSLETFENWKNLAKARGLDFAAKDKKEDGVKRYGLPFPGEARKVNGSPWTR